MELYQIIIAILATYRLSQLLPEDDGPLFIFTRLRGYTARKAEKSGDPLGLWSNIDSGINCVYCCGLYAALLVVALVMTQNFYANLFLLWFAIAGGQTLIERLSKR